MVCQSTRLACKVGQSNCFQRARSTSSTMDVAEDAKDRSCGRTLAHHSCEYSKLSDSYVPPNFLAALSPLIPLYYQDCEVNYSHNSGKEHFDLVILAFQLGLDRTFSSNYSFLDHVQSDQVSVHQLLESVLLASFSRYCTKENEFVLAIKYSCLPFSCIYDSFPRQSLSSLSFKMTVVA